MKHVLSRQTGTVLGDTSPRFDFCINFTPNLMGEMQVGWWVYCFFGLLAGLMDFLIGCVSVCACVCVCVCACVGRCACMGVWDLDSTCHRET